MKFKFLIQTLVWLLEHDDMILKDEILELIRSRFVELRKLPYNRSFTKLFMLPFDDDLLVKF